MKFIVNCLAFFILINSSYAYDNFNRVNNYESSKCQNQYFYLKSLSKNKLVYMIMNLQDENQDLRKINRRLQFEIERYKRRPFYYK